MRARTANLLVVAGYAFLTVAMTWPLAAHVTTHLAGNDIDVWINPWANWWTRKAIVEGLDLYHTDYLFWPEGSDLYFHSFSHFNTGVWMLIEPLVGAIAAQNVTTLAAYYLSAVGTYLLVLHVSGSRFAAVISGFVFSFSPWHIEQSSHPVINTTQWIPMFMLCLIRTVRERQMRWAVGAAAFLWLNALSSWHLFLFSLILGGLYVVVGLIADSTIRSWEVVRLLAACAIIAVLLVSPLVCPLLREYLSGQNYVATRGGSRALDLLGLVTPSHRHPVVGHLMPTGYGRFTTRISVFGGCTVLMLSVLTSILLWPRVRFWALSAILSLGLSLGTNLQLGGTVYEGVRFPWGDAVARFFRAPDRFFVIFGLSTAVLTGYGLAHLGGGTGRECLRRLGIWLVAGLIVFEFLYTPFPLLQPTVPEFYERIAEEPGEFAVLDLPLDRRREYMYYQTVHERPLVGGTVSRTSTASWEYIEGNPFLTGIRTEEIMDPALVDISRQLMALARDKIRYLIIHRQMIEPPVLQQWRDYLTVPPFYESEELLVYRTSPPHGVSPALVHEWEQGMGLARADVGSAPVLSQGSVVAVDVRWFANRAMSQDLKAVLSLVGAAGEIADSAVFTISPDWTTSEWPAGAVVAQGFAWQLDPFLSPGDYAFSLSVAAEADDIVDNWILLQRIEVRSLPRVFEPPFIFPRLDVDFGGQILLLGFDLRRDVDRLTLILHWQALQRMDVSYKVFVHLTDEAGEIAVQDDAAPRRWTYPTTWWEVGEIVSDEIPLALGDVPPGEYNLYVGVYEQEGRRLLTDAGSASVVLLEGIVVP